ncbi:putative ABC transport system ATP-binding protein [Loktanella atrilutea]|uniref:Putative ABC transport system ATP-binding protein n=1 Tax=Loktanella atrilutea TaxID=366533 RepID=A0A1M4YTK4_LOKAT|nr:ABC transporter ATP-binding protein [Loktanella atrilutea]SHF09100.1 putative ABC transport system ATP-binding protein [Loktanella atrilutea]
MFNASLSRYIWEHTRRQQLWILAIVALSMIPYYMAFSLPKTIVNGPIQGDGFETADATQTFLRIALPLPGADVLVLFQGITLDRVHMLFALSGVFLLLVIVNGLFKFYINAYKGKLGERLLRRIRYALVDHVLRFPPATFKFLKSPEIASMIKDEVEPMGGFTGDAFVSPALLGGQALTALAFIFAQNLMLGGITAALIGAQILIIPRMRRRLLVLGRERQLTARQLSGRVGEIVESIGTIHANDTTNFERADISARLGRIFTIRYDIYQWKFLVKFINNFLASLAPFIFYSLGGYLALTGHLDIGQLVAVIGAYSNLPGPMKELIDWDQNRQDVEIKYQQVIGQFAVDNMIASDLHTARRTAEPLDTPLAAIGVRVMDDGGVVSLDHTDFTLEPGEALAAIGPAGSGSETFAELFARQVWPSSGRIVAGQSNILALPEAVTGRSISYAGGDAVLLSGSLLDNLTYGLRNSPPDPDGRAPSPSRRWQLQEARRSGNPDYDRDADWIDYDALDLTGPESLTRHLLEVLDCVDMTRDMQDLALNSTVSERDYPDLAGRIVAIRGQLRTELEQGGLAELIVPFAIEAYNTEATILENLLFGRLRPNSALLDPSERTAFFRRLLQQAGLYDRLCDAGVEIARNVIGLFADLPPDHPFFRQMTFMSPDDIPTYQALLLKFDKSGGVPTEQDRTMMVGLAFEYIEPRHRFGLLDTDLMAEIVAFRRFFHNAIPDHLRPVIEIYDAGRFTDSATLMDNILFGRVSQKYRDGADQVRSAILDLLQRQGVFAEVLTIGLGFDVGTGGRRLSAGQRQKVALARALVRPSDYYIFNRPLTALDNRSQDLVLTRVLSRLRNADRAPAVLWTLSNPQMARHFDRIAVFEAGKLVEVGTPTALEESNGIFSDMIAS